MNGSDVLIKQNKLKILKEYWNIYFFFLFCRQEGYSKKCENPPPKNNKP